MISATASGGLPTSVSTIRSATDPYSGYLCAAASRTHSSPRSSHGRCGAFLARRKSVSGLARSQTTRLFSSRRRDESDRIVPPAASTMCGGGNWRPATRASSSAWRSSSTPPASRAAPPASSRTGAGAARRCLPAAIPYSPRAAVRSSSCRCPSSRRAPRGIGQLPESRSSTITAYRSVIPATWSTAWVVRSASASR